MVLTAAAFQRLCHARGLLAEAAEDPRSIKDIAREIRMSHFHFIRQFRALFGLTPHQFRIRARLERAKLILAAGQHSVTGVCMEVGMSSLGSFSHLFERRVGSPPSKYRHSAESFPGCLSLMSAQFPRSNPVESCVEFGNENQIDQPHGGRSG